MRHLATQRHELTFVSMHSIGSILKKAARTRVSYIDLDAVRPMPECLHNPSRKHIHRSRRQVQQVVSVIWLDDVSVRIPLIDVMNNQSLYDEQIQRQHGPSACSYY